MDKLDQQIRFCKSHDGTRIAYAVCGTGPPLVRAGHSFSHLEGEWDCSVWRHWIEMLACGRTLVRYDMRGTGLSDRAGITFSFDRYLEDLEAVVEASGLKRFDLFGMAAGGALAVAYAAAHPRQVARLLIYGAPSRGRIIRSRGPEDVEEAELLLKLVEIGWGQDNALFRQLFTYLFCPDATSQQLRSLNEFMRLATSATNAVQLLRGVFMCDVQQAAQQVSCSTLVLHSRGDTRMPFEEGRTLAALIPGARFVPLDSHNSLLLESEPAWGALVREVERFLSANDAHLPNSIEALTSRERAVLNVLAQGTEAPVMAERLGMSPKTLRNHLSTIYSKLGVANRAQAIILAREQGFGRNSAR